PLVTRTQCEVVRVGEDDGGTDLVEVVRIERLDGGVGAHGHEHGGPDLAVGGRQHPGAGTRRAIVGRAREHPERHGPRRGIRGHAHAISARSVASAAITSASTRYTPVVMSAGSSATGRSSAELISVVSADAAASITESPMLNGRYW